VTETQKEIARLLIGLAEYLQTTMSKEQLKLYTMEFDSPEYLGACIMALKQDPDLRPGTMPLPAKIKAALEVPLDEQAYALVRRIFEAAKRYGYYQPGDAKKFMGPLGWSVVQAYGGWQQVCMIETKGMGTAFAQLRDLAISIQKVERIGGIRERIGIETDRGKIEHLSERGATIGELVHQKLAEIAERSGSDQ